MLDLPKLCRILLCRPTFPARNSIFSQTIVIQIGKPRSDWKIILLFKKSIDKSFASFTLETIFEPEKNWHWRISTCIIKIIIWTYRVTIKWTLHLNYQFKIVYLIPKRNLTLYFETHQHLSKNRLNILGDSYGHGALEYQYAIDFLDSTKRCTILDCQFRLQCLPFFPFSISLAQKSITLDPLQVPRENSQSQCVG